MILKRVLVPLIALLVAFSTFTACGNPKKESVDILFCYADSNTNEFGGEVYEKAINSLNLSGHKVVQLGSNPSNYVQTLNSEVAKKSYKAIVIIGEKAFEGLTSYVKSYKGMKFIALDCNLTELRENVTALEFNPEEFGYLGGSVLSSQVQGEFTAGYLSTVRNSYDNRILYGFMQALKQKNAKNVYAKYIEESSSVLKAIDYANAIYSSGAQLIFDLSGRNSLGTIESAMQNNKKVVYGGVNLKQALLNSKGENSLNHVFGGVEKNYAVAIKKACEMVKNGFESNAIYEIGRNDDAFIIDGNYEIGSIKKLDKNKEDFDSLASELLVSENQDYSPKYSVEAKYHEAVPSCLDTNDWKYAPRAGSNNGKKPQGWKALGVWATIYLQEGQNPVSNTGIEFQNMRLWAYTATSGWILLEHANPTGSFYDENFSNDQHTSFISNYINYGSEKRTRIKLDYSTLGYNYHPFGSQISLVEAGLVDQNGNVINGDILYVLSEMDIRLCVWDLAVESDIDDAKYVANIGADWWREVGLGWSPDWNNNKDVCVGQFRTITKEWKRLYMTNVPSELYEEIFASFPFSN